MGRSPWMYRSSHRTRLAIVHGKRWRTCAATTVPADARVGKNHSQEPRRHRDTRNYRTAERGGRSTRDGLRGPLPMSSITGRTPPRHRVQLYHSCTRRRPRAVDAAAAASASGRHHAAQMESSLPACAERCRTKGRADSLSSTALGAPCQCAARGTRSGSEGRRPRLSLPALRLGRIRRACP